MASNFIAGNAFQKDYDLWEYLLVAHPDGVVRDRIAVEKNFLEANDPEGSAAGTQPHITIGNFLARERMEETLVRWIQNICNLHAPFTVTLNNFSGLPPHTVYLRVQDPKPFQQLAGALHMLDGFIRSNDCPPLVPVQKPHLTIASGLPGHLYEAALKEYAGRSFHASFTVEKLALVRRDAAMKSYLVNTFILTAPLPVAD